MFTTYITTVLNRIFTEFPKPLQCIQDVLSLIHKLDLIICIGNPAEKYLEPTSLQPI